jgi:hypothetical protein
VLRERKVEGKSKAKRNTFAMFGIKHRDVYRLEKNFTWRSGKALLTKCSGNDDKQVFGSGV